MPSVQVKDFPQDLYDQLKAYSELNHRSMSQQLIVAAEQMLASANDTPAASAGAKLDQDQARLARIAKRKALHARIESSIGAARNRGRWKDSQLDIVGLIREDRDSISRHTGGPDYDAQNRGAKYVRSKAAQL